MQKTPTVRDPRSEAEARLGTGLARVLEPSPPAVQDGDWFADDPTAAGPGDASVVVPAGCGPLTWDAVIADRPELAEFARDGWLADHRRLEPLPAEFASTRENLHRVGFHVLSTVRENATGKIALRWTRDGFGTPFYGEDEQLRVEGTLLVHQSGPSIRHTPITTLDAAARFAGIAYEPEKAERFDAPPAIAGGRALAVEPAAARALADWFGFGYSVLEELRRAALPDDDAGRVQLWAEHFDPAVEIGDADAGRRASYGASPGDAAHPEPYLYVAAWGEVDRSDPFWNDESFNGAHLPYRELIDATDQRVAALAFYRRGLATLTDRPLEEVAGPGNGR